MRFHSAMAPLEPQKYAIARTVGTENILLVSGRLVIIIHLLFTKTVLVKQNLEVAVSKLALNRF